MFKQQHKLQFKLQPKLQPKKMSLRTLINTLKPTILFSILASTLVLSACANKDKDDANESERALYQSAQKALDRSQYDYALELFRKIELRFPFGRYAEQAQLESIYAYYKNGEPAAADVSAERFIRQYPEHPNLDYAQYLKGLSNYRVDNGLVGRFIERSSVKRDLNSAKQAYLDFNLLIESFPQSDYVADAQKRMFYIRDLIAQQEIEVANYYMQRTAYIATINRSKAVLENYPGTTASADALALLVYAYQELNSPDLANDSLRVLTHNFPNYEKLQSDGSLAPYDKLYTDRVDWLNLISFGFLNKNKQSGQNDDAVSETSSSAPEATSLETAPRPKALQISAAE